MTTVGGKQKTVLITGVSRGLGKALAEEFVKLGHTIIGCSRSQDKLDALQAQLSSPSPPDNSADASIKHDNKHLFVNVDVVRTLSLSLITIVYILLTHFDLIDRDFYALCVLVEVEWKCARVGACCHGKERCSRYHRYMLCYHSIKNLPVCVIVALKFIHSDLWPTP